jgi:hypothetical protein
MLTFHDDLSCFPIIVVSHTGGKICSKDLLISQRSMAPAPVVKKFGIGFALNSDQHVFVHGSEVREVNMSSNDLEGFGSGFNEPVDPANEADRLSAAGAPVASRNRARSIRHRKGSRSDCCRGETLTVELRDAQLIPAMVLDESHLGLSLGVGDATLFRPAQAILVRRRGVRNAAVVKYVLRDASLTRIGLRLYPL